MPRAIVKREDDGPEEYKSYKNPVGERILDISDKKVLNAEFSEWEGERYWNLRFWVQKRDGTWIRTKGLSLPSKHVREFYHNLGDYMDEMAAKAKRRRRA